MKRKNVHCILRYHTLLDHTTPLHSENDHRERTTGPSSRPSLLMCVQSKGKKKEKQGQERNVTLHRTMKKLNHGERVVQTFEPRPLSNWAQIQSRNVPVSTIELSATPNDPFSEYQSTTDPPKSSLEPLKPKEATGRIECCIFSRAAEKQCPLTRDAQLNKNDILV